MYTKYEENQWNTLMREFLYKLNSLLQDNAYEIRYESWKVKSIDIKQLKITVRNEWDSYNCFDDDIFLSFHYISSYGRTNSMVLHDTDFTRKTVDSIKIIKTLDNAELFPEYQIKW